MGSTGIDSEMMGVVSMSSYRVAARKYNIRLFLTGEYNYALAA